MDENNIEQNIELNEKLTESENKNTDATNKNTEAKSKNNEAVNTGNKILDYSANMLSLITKKYEELNKEIFKSSEFSNATTLALGQATSMIIDSTKLFSNLAKTDISSNFMEQYSSIKSAIDSVMNSAGKGNIDKITNDLKAFGLSLPIDVIQKGASAIDQYLTKQFEAADASLRLRDAIIANSSATGTLGDVFDQAGESLGNLNAVILKHQDLMAKTQQATGIKDVQAYYNELSKLPGALHSLVSTSEDGTQTTTALAATINLARGAGINYSDVISGMREALNDYTSDTDEAIKYVSRMAEVSQKLGVEYNLVQGFIKSTSDVMGKFGNNTDGTANILLKYTQALRETGATQKQSIDMLNHMTKSIGGLNMAQKGLLSARSGGPGGLMGALKIEDLMRKDKIDEVMSMVMKDMTKQFGKVVTMDEAVKDPRLAAQFQKQRMMLTQGPYGQLAGSEQEATRLLQMFGDVQSGKASMKELFKPEGNQSAASGFIEKGQKLGMQTATPFGLVGKQMEDISGKGAISALNAVQGAFAASTGTQMFGNNDPNIKLRENTRMEMEKSGKTGTDRFSNYINENKKKGLYSDNLNSQYAQDFRSSAEYAGKALKDSVVAIPNMFDMHINKNTPEKRNRDLNQDVAMIARQQEAPEARSILPRIKEEKDKKEGKDKQELVVKLIINEKESKPGEPINIGKNSQVTSVNPSVGGK